MAKRILIVEDDTSFGVLVEKLLQKDGYEVCLCSKMEPAKREVSLSKFDVILSDLRLPDGDGIMLLAWLKENRYNVPVIIMTSYAEVQSAVSAIKLGASDYLEKPINPTILKQKIGQILEQGVETPVEKAPVVKNESKGELKVVTGVSEVAQEMYQHLRLVAPTPMSVLILGESGTGKEYAAKLIHDCSSRNKAPFIAVDCGSLSKELAPSELFGHLKGSFTSALSDKKGVFEQANGGTVFLDEIGNLSYDVQIQLLRALQEQKVRPVGAAKDVKVDVRILAATNENLEGAIVNGTFREDLYHRLNEFTIFVPPLRDRIGDIEIFAKHFLKQANEELSKDIKGFSKSAIKKLAEHHWSGNLRELRNVVRRAVLFAQQSEIVPDNLPILAAAPKSNVEIYGLQPNNTREQIEQALKQARGNKALAARILKIDRKTLYNKMHQLGMDI